MLRLGYIIIVNYSVLNSVRLKYCDFLCPSTSMKKQVQVHKFKAEYFFRMHFILCVLYYQGLYP